FPSTNSQHTTTIPSRVDALTSHAIRTTSNNNNTHTTPSAYHYDSSEFQVENPFADTYSTSTSLLDNDNHNSSHTTTTAAAAIRGTDRDRDPTTEPLTSSTYYPDARNVMVDGNMPGAGGAVGTTTRGPRVTERELAASYIRQPVYEHDYLWDDLWGSLWDHWLLLYELPQNLPEFPGLHEVELDCLWDNLWGDRWDDCHALRLPLLLLDFQNFHELEPVLDDDFLS
ncbi:hypothetical protein ACJ73_06700, partial [Blastomyces percursus]